MPAWVTNFQAPKQLVLAECVSECARRSREALQPKIKTTMDQVENRGPCVVADSVPSGIVVAVNPPQGSILDSSKVAWSADSTNLLSQAWAADRTSQKAAEPTVGSWERFTAALWGRDRQDSCQQKWLQSMSDCARRHDETPHCGTCMDRQYLCTCSSSQQDVDEP